MVENLGIENTPIGQELLAYATKTRPRIPLGEEITPPRIPPERVQDLGAGLLKVLGIANGIARLYQRYFEALLEGVSAPEITLGGEELLVLAPIETSVEHPFTFQWIHAPLPYYGSAGEPQREEPQLYHLIVKCEGGEEWAKEVPGSTARREFSIHLGREEMITTVYSTEPEFHFKELPAGTTCTWEVKAFSSQGELMGSSGQIRFRIFDPKGAMLSDLDYFLLGLFLESAERFDDAASLYQKIADERQRALALLGMFERRLERLEEEIEGMESKGGEEERVNQLKKEGESLLMMVNLYRAKVRELLSRRG